MADYDIASAFAEIEKQLIASMIRNMDRHRAEETDTGYNWSQWQVEQLKGLERYKAANQKKYDTQFRDINSQIGEMIRVARSTGGMAQEISILNAIRDGFKAEKVGAAISGEFFRLNDRKLESLIRATTSDMRKAETAILRQANDQYRKVIYNAQMYANSGAGTYEKAVDMATKNMLAGGLTCVEYANGARHTLADYSDMAIRTASKRAYLQGEGEKRQEWGIATVIVNRRGNPCPKCLPFVGKVFIDDVWSGGSARSGEYPLMSGAVAAGLYHPRCKDSHTTYFEGISEPPDSQFRRSEIDRIEDDYKQDQYQQHAKRQAEKYERLAMHSLDPENRKNYGARAKQWREKSSFEYEDTPLYYNSDTDYSIALDEYLDKVNAGLSKAAENVAIRGSIDRNEHMYLVNLKTGALEYYETNGLPDSVGYSALRYAAEHPRKQFAFVHNHNIVSSLSETDLTTPLVCANIPAQIAVQNNGVKYIAIRTGNSPTNFYADITYEKELEELNSLSRHGKITPIERMQRREQIVVECILRDYYPEGVLVNDGRK